MKQRSIVQWCLVVTTVVVIMFLVACGAPTLATPAGSAEEDQALSGLATPDPQAMPASTGAENIGGVATARLAGWLDVDEEEILVKSVEAIDWPDTSLGCPQPGMMYAQMIKPGYRVILEVAGQTYEIHTDGGQTTVMCDE